MPSPRSVPLFAPIVGLLALAALLAGCSSDDGDDATSPTASPDADLESATVTLEDDQALVGRLTVTSDEPALPDITVTGEERTFEVPVAEAAEEVVVPVAGLRPESDYEIEVTVNDDTETLELTTGSLPEGMPAIGAAVSEPEQLADGVTLFNLLDINAPGPDEVGDGEAPQLGWLVAVDAEGEVVWYHRADHPMGDVRQLDDGTFLVEHDDRGADVIDLFGDVQQSWAGELGIDALDPYGRTNFPDDPAPMATETMHHEVGMLPNGNLLALSTELQTYSGFDEARCQEADGEFDGTYDLISDIVVEVAPDGEIVGEWPLDEVLDPVDGPPGDQNVCGIPIPGVFPTSAYVDAGEPDARDWTHANGVILVEEHNALIVSVRHIDAVLALRYQDDEDGPAGEVLWRLGPDGGLDLADGGDWTYHQHAPELQEDGSLVLYDNGNARPGTDTTMPPGDEASYSRAVRYDISDLWEGGTEVTQLWERRSEVDGEPAYASFVGDADVLENGNVLITDGGLAAGADGEGPSAVITEVVPEGESGGEVVLELRVDGGPDWFVYRAERIPSLYG